MVRLKFGSSGDPVCNIFTFGMARRKDYNY